MTKSVLNKVIVIEGMGGAGKTTAATMLAERYGLSNFNTGTLFRASAAAMLYDKVSLEETGDFVRESAFDIEHGLKSPNVAVNGRDVSELLQLPEVTRVSSRIGQIDHASAHLESIFDQTLELNGDMVIEGKHLAERAGRIATHLFFFDARLDVRAHRKWRQAHLGGRSEYTAHEAFLDTYLNDQRDKGLLVMPAGAEFELVDTSQLTPLEVVQHVAERAELR